MASLLDASVWIDFTRARSPRSLKELIAPYILSPEAHLSELVMFEVLRYATDDESQRLQAQFENIPVLRTPPSVWREATELGQACRRHGITVGSLDLLIGAVAIHHAVELVTFDSDFERMATVTRLRVHRLQRPSE